MPEIDAFRISTSWQSPHKAPFAIQKGISGVAVTVKVKDWTDSGGVLQEHYCR